MTKTKLKYHFHNPNSDEVTAEFLCKILIEANADKVERAIEEAAMQCGDDKEYIVETEEVVEKRKDSIKIKSCRRRAR